MKHIRSAEYQQDDEKLAAIAKAMAHPARIAILKILRKTMSCCCGDIVDELPIAQATVSQHLKELKEAGLIKGQIEAPRVCYCIDEDNWKFAKKIFEDFFK